MEKFNVCDNKVHWDREIFRFCMIHEFSDLSKYIICIFGIEAKGNVVKHIKFVTLGFSVCYWPTL